MAETLSQLLKRIGELEAAGDIEAAAVDRKRIEDAGYGDRLPPLPVTMPEKPKEKSFMDQWGRPIAEGAGSLLGGTAGAIAGGGPTAGLGALPGIAAGAALGGEAAGYGFDKIGEMFGKEAPERSPQEIMTGAAFNAMGGPTPVPSMAPAMLAGKVPEGGLFDIAPKGNTIDEKIAEHGGRWTAANRGSPLAQKAESQAQSSPFSVDIVTGHTERNLNALSEIAEEATPTAASRNVAGTRAGLGFEEAVKGSEMEIDLMYKALDDALEEGGGSTLERISMDSLQKIMKGYNDLVKRDGRFADMVFSDPDLKGAMDAMQSMLDQEALYKRGIPHQPYGLAPDTGPTRPTYDVIKRLRTIIGRKIDDSFNVSGEAEGQKLLYRTLSDDLEAGVREIGGEAAVQARVAADAANTKHKEGVKYLEKIFGPKNIDSPEKMYEALSSAVISDPNRLAAAKRALPKRDWDRFVDTYIRRLTAAKPGQQDITATRVSPRTTVTNVAKLKHESPEGYKVLTEGREAAVEVIEEIAQGLTEAETYYNRSHTAGALSGQQFIHEVGAGSVAAGAGLFTGGPTAAATMGLAALAIRPMVSRMFATALTNDRFARALTKVKNTYRDGLPEGMALAKALLAAGADDVDVQPLIDAYRDKGAQPPLAEAGKSGGLY